MSSYICKKSGVSFEVSNDDIEFYQRISPSYSGTVYQLPMPQLCPELRAMRRLAWRNSNNIYSRLCSKSGQKVLSGYPSESPYPIYANEIWWGDSWDPLASGREFDFSRPFFAQFQELMHRAPRPALMNRDSENSVYCNYAGKNKNCYMANNGSWYNQNCLFGEAYLHCSDCLDCSYLRKSELCYQAVRSEGLYDCAFIVNSFHSANCYFSFNLRNCKDCFLCSNLRNQSGYILNKPASTAELASFREKLASAAGIAELKAKYAELYRESIHPAVSQINCEDCTGEYLTNCKNVQSSFLVGSIRDGKNLLHCDEGNDMWDCSLSGYANSELYLETVSSGDGGRQVLFCSASWSSSDVAYCDTVMSCRNCFGCVGLQRQEYCILNRSYSKDEYFALVPRIIEHMRQTGEWGEFFPEEIAPHAYNESAAQDFFPLSEDAARGYGYRWRDVAVNDRSTAVSEIPDSIDAASDAVCEQTFVCAESGKPFRIAKLELSLLRQLRITPPRLAPEIRREQRNAQRNQPRFWQRSCCLTGEPIITAFAPDGVERVCSEKAYRAQVYE